MAKLINLKTFKSFFSSSSSGGIILLICVIVSLIIANTGAGQGFSELLAQKIGYSNSWLDLEYSVSSWINDGLMAIFFLLVGLEIKREIIEGELSSMRQASLPVLAALGGVIAPALIYTLFNHAEPTTMHGWGIPMATDIAFALGIISLLGNKVPNGLKVFLAALAIVDDLMAILVIAIFYTSHLHLNYLMYAGLIFLLQIIFNRLKIKNVFFYVIPGIFMWYFIHHSGIHATIAGVLTALTLPTTPDATESPLEKLEHFLAKPVNFIIMPIFAIANTNIAFQSGMAGGLASSLGLGIILGLFIGKPIGIFCASWLSVKMKAAQLPENTTWKHVLGLGMLGGIGFTMSVFISVQTHQLKPIFPLNEAKFAILTASVLSGICGFTMLKLYHKKRKANGELTPLEEQA